MSASNAVVFVRLVGILGGGRLFPTYRRNPEKSQGSLEIRRNRDLHPGRPASQNGWEFVC